MKTFRALGCRLLQRKRGEGGREREKKEGGRTVVVVEVGVGVGGVMGKQIKVIYHNCANFQWHSPNGALRVRGKRRSSRDRGEGVKKIKSGDEWGYKKGVTRVGDK